jgi:hypothetical protein
MMRGGCTAGAGRREGSMTVEVSSNGVEYTRGGMAHREARLTVVGPSTGPEARLVGDGMMRGGMHSRCRFGCGHRRSHHSRFWCCIELQQQQLRIRPFMDSHMMPKSTLGEM